MPVPADDIPRLPGSIGHAVLHLIRSRGLLERSSVDALNDAWKKTVGPELAQYSRAVRIRGGIVDVAVTNSATLQELRSFLHETTLKQLQEILPDSGIRGLRYRRTPS
ncbi:MAG: hypothetical protein RLZZ458_510 [Planctomycetota bacterium]